MRLSGANQFTMRAVPVVVEVPYGGGFNVTAESISDKQELKGSLTTELCYSQAKMLLDFPDFERTQNLAQAAYNLVQKLIERMLDAEDTDADDAYTYPEPFMNLDLCISATQQAYLDAKIEGADPKNLKLLSQFIQDSVAEKNKPAEEAAKKAKDDADAAAANAAAQGAIAPPVTIPNGPLPGMPPAGPPAPPPGPPGGIPMAA